MGRRWMKVVPTATLTAVTFTMMEQPAQALFPPLWPVSPPVSVITPPIITPPIVVPPVNPPPFNPPPVVVPPVTPPPVIVPPPTTIPEPSTLIAGLGGLAAAAGWRARQRKQSEPKA